MFRVVITAAVQTFIPAQPTTRYQTIVKKKRNDDAAYYIYEKDTKQIWENIENSRS